MQTEKAKSSHFDRTRGDKKQIFPTYDSKACSKFFCGKTRINMSLKTCINPSSTVKQNQVKVFNPTPKQFLSLDFKQKKC